MVNIIGIILLIALGWYGIYHRLREGSRRFKIAFSGFCMVMVLYAAIKPPQNTGGGDDSQQRETNDGGRVTLLDTETTVTRSGELDTDGDGIPDWFEDATFSDKLDPSDAEGYHPFDLTMGLLEKYEEGPLDFRTIDSMGDGIPDSWKRQWGLNLMDFLALTTASNGLTFYQCYMTDANPLAPVTNPANHPLTDADVVERGYLPGDTVPPEVIAAATNGVPSGAAVILLSLSGEGAPYVRVRVGAAVILLSLSGEGAPYVRVRVGAAVHAGTKTGRYAVTPGLHDVEVERLPAMAGGAGLPVKVTIGAERGIVAGLKGYTDSFTVPPEGGAGSPSTPNGGGGFAPLSAPPPKPKVVVIKMDAESDNDFCLHGHGRVTLVPTSAAHGKLTGGSASWKWEAAPKSYGTLSASGLTVSITVDETAHGNWKDYKDKTGSQATQPLKYTYTPPNSWDVFFDWISGKWEGSIAMGCCLTYKPEENEHDPDCQHHHCDCT